MNKMTILLLWKIIIIQVSKQREKNVNPLSYFDFFSSTKFRLIQTSLVFAYL